MASGGLRSVVALIALAAAVGQQQAYRIVIWKARREMVLLSHGKVVHSYEEVYRLEPNGTPVEINL